MNQEQKRKKSVFLTENRLENITISYDNQLTIEGADTITGTTGNLIARFNSTTVNPEWTIVNGNNFATIDNRGNITIISSGTIEVEAEYVRNNNTYTTTSPRNYHTNITNNNTTNSRMVTSV